MDWDLRVSGILEKCCFRPLVERRELLSKLLKKAPENIKFSEELQGTKGELLQVAREFQLEGLIAKRPDSLYESGRRSGAWVKVKLTQEQEFVIGVRLGCSSPVELAPAFPKKL